MAISWDGKVTVCCSDVDFKLYIGKVEDGLLNLFNSDTINYYRKLHFFKRFDRMPLCSNCLDGVTLGNYIPDGLRERIVRGEIDRPLLNNLSDLIRRKKDKGVEK
jgi:hypothetical protein